MRLNGWNRLFVVTAACWALVAPFLLMENANRPIEQAQHSCDDVAYNRYGSSSSAQLDMNKYNSEVKKCIDNYVRDAVSLPKVLSAMVGQDRELGLVAWGFILVPLALLWIVSWVVGRIAYWVAAGFRR
jgi:hypothetical protein